MSEQKSQQENIQLPNECSQQLKLTQARIANADLANMDMRNEITASIQMLLMQISKLQKENAELKAKQEKTSIKTNTG